ncbi:MAG: hypothetical protein Q8P17_04305 [bacterium]|nr:hypothetical protein [bacterium]
MDKELIKTPMHSDFLPVVTGTHHQTEFVKFAIWYGTPGQFRQPETQKEFAESIGMCEDTLTDWKRHSQFSFFVWQTTKEWIKDHMTDVIGGLYLKASSEKAGARDVELFLRLAEVDINNDKKK